MTDQNATQAAGSAAAPAAPPAPGAAQAAGQGKAPAAPGKPAPTAAEAADAEREAAYRARLAEEAAKAGPAAAAEAAGTVLITDFAGTPGGVFAVYGVNLNKEGAQLTINGQVPEVRVVRVNVIKGLLRAPGLNLKAGPVKLTLGSASFEGVL